MSRRVIRTNAFMWILVTAAAALALQVALAQKPPAPSKVQITVTGTPEELKSACAFLMPRLEGIKGPFFNGCKEKFEKSVPFIFERTAVLEEKRILDLFNEAFLDQVKKSEFPPKNLTIAYAWRPCLKKQYCMGAERWWPCECP